MDVHCSGHPLQEVPKVLLSQETSAAKSRGLLGGHKTPYLVVPPRGGFGVPHAAWAWGKGLRCPEVCGRSWSRRQTLCPSPSTLRSPSRDCSLSLFFWRCFLSGCSPCLLRCSWLSGLSKEAFRCLPGEAVWVRAAPGPVPLGLESRHHVQEDANGGKPQLIAAAAGLTP